MCVYETWELIEETKKEREKQIECNFYNSMTFVRTEEEKKKQRNKELVNVVNNTIYTQNKTKISPKKKEKWRNQLGKKIKWLNG